MRVDVDALSLFDNLAVNLGIELVIVANLSVLARRQRDGAAILRRDGLAEHVRALLPLRLRHAHSEQLPSMREDEEVHVLVVDTVIIDHLRFALVRKVILLIQEGILAGNGCRALCRDERFERFRALLDGRVADAIRDALVFECILDHLRRRHTRALHDVEVNRHRELVGTDVNGHAGVIRRFFRCFLARRDAGIDVGELLFVWHRIALREEHGRAVGCPHGLCECQDVIVVDTVIVQNLPHIGQLVKNRTLCRRIDGQENAFRLELEEVAGVLAADLGFFRSFICHVPDPLIRFITGWPSCARVSRAGGRPPSYGAGRCAPP